MASRFVSLACLVPLLGACDNAVTVELSTGAQTVEIAASSLMLPAELRDTSTSPATVRRLDCAVTMICPSTPEVAVTCTAGVCDPAPRTVAVPVGDVVDFDSLLSEARSLLRFVDSIEVVRVDYQVSPNSLTVPLPEVAIYWGPEGAADISATGVALLGTIPMLDAATSSMGEMVIDAAGSAALSDYVVSVDRRVRFFAETRVDLAPGGPFPDGSATITANVRVRAIGRVVGG
jgi:hypothetical protein